MTVDMAMANNSTLLQDIEDKFKSKLPPTVDYLVGVYMIFVCVTSICVNLLVLVTVYKRERPLNPLEIYVVNLAVIDILPAVFSYPIDITSLFSHHWPLGMIGCRFAAAMVYFFGIASITTVAVMSVMRYLKVCHPSLDKYVNKKSICLSLLIVYTNSLVWTIGPLLGWGSYAPEPFGVTCTLDWKTIPVSYLASIFTFEYILPFAIIIFSYGNVIMTLCMARRNMTTIKTRMDIYLTKMAMIMSASFLIAWTPYSIVAFTYYFHDYDTVPLALAAAAPYTAKSSTIYNPIIYFLAVKRFRQDVYDLMSGLFSIRTNNTGQHVVTQVSKVTFIGENDKDCDFDEVEALDETDPETVQLTVYYSKTDSAEENTYHDAMLGNGKFIES